jgi:hypothetical protein
MLCDKCRSLHFKPIENTEPSRPRIVTPDLYVHSESRADLERTKLLGCHFCALLSSLLDRHAAALATVRRNAERPIKLGIMPERGHGASKRWLPPCSIAHGTTILENHIYFTPSLPGMSLR